MACGCSATEPLDGDDKFFCDACKGLQDAQKRMKISVLPRVLCLHLKRFKYIEQQDRCALLASAFTCAILHIHLQRGNNCIAVLTCQAH